MQFTTFGKNSRQGSYLLFIRLHAPARLSFGKFMGGKEITLDHGNYLYVGSALGSNQRAFPLASRLLRHASRSGELPPHEIRGCLIGLFTESGYEPTRKSHGKNLHWHIDYLLDLAAAELYHVVMVKSPERLEHHLAKLVSSMQDVAPIADRLGAQDAASGTHLFKVENPTGLLNQLKHSIPPLL
ncbi:MAG: GIY-YIG nuclease family protein [Chlorobiaceae bacterium]|nr:GIY-YIG nuclease family protein [Chlorobiaceae bacterium]